MLTFLRPRIIIDFKNDLVLTEQDTIGFNLNRRIERMKDEKLTNRLWALLLIVLSLYVMASCAALGEPKDSSSKGLPSSVDVPPSPGILRVGVSTNAPPLIYKQGAEIVGLEAELAKEFAKFLGKSHRFVEVKWEDQIPALLNNRTDIIMAGMSITKMREVRISFSVPYFRTGQMALIHRKDKNRFPQGYYGILGQAIVLRIGVVKGTTGENFVRKNFGSAKKISSFETSKSAVDALLQRSIDMLIHDGPIVLMLAAEAESAGLTVLPSLMTEEYLAWGIRKNDVALLDSANSFLDKLQKEGRLDKIVKRWIPYEK